MKNIPKIAESIVALYNTGLPSGMNTQETDPEPELVKDLGKDETSQSDEEKDSGAGIGIQGMP